MCGAFAWGTRSKTLKDLYPWLELDERLPEERYNIRPTEPGIAVPNWPLKTPEKVPVKAYRFGFKGWKSPSQVLINTRDDTLMKGSNFWKPYVNNRCLIFATGFYEWQLQEDGSKQPYYFKIDGGRIFSFAGLYKDEETEDGLTGYFSILTTTATDFVAGIHNTKKRMPVILPEEKMQDWISPEPMELDEIASFLTQYPEDRMEAYPVAKAVGNPKAEGEELTLPSATQGSLFGKD